MIIALFGITCVGKTTVGKIISEKLGYEFYDLDEELKLYFNDTISNIQDSSFNRYGFDGKKGIVLKEIIGKCSENATIAVSPIYYTVNYNNLFKKNNVFSIVLQDTPENIVDRMIYTDDDDNIIEINLAEAELKEELSDVKYFISRYKNAYSRIEHHYQINGKTADEVADDIIKLYCICEGQILDG